MCQNYVFLIRINLHFKFCYKYYGNFTDFVFLVMSLQFYMYTEGPPKVITLQQTKFSQKRPESWKRQKRVQSIQEGPNLINIYIQLLHFYYYLRLIYLYNISLTRVQRLKKHGNYTKIYYNYIYLFNFYEQPMR